MRILRTACGRAGPEVFRPRRRRRSEPSRRHGGVFRRARSGYRSYSPELGRWINRDPIGEKGGANLYEFVRNEPIDAFDPLGLIPPMPGPSPPPGPRIPPPPKGPLADQAEGFEMCRRDVIELRKVDRLANDCCPGLHMFVRQKLLNDQGAVSYRGWGFDDSGFPRAEGNANPKSNLTCVACRRANRVLQHGPGAKLPGTLASDEQIWQCLVAHPNRKGYGLLLYNCRDYAYEDAGACGLDCGRVPPPAGRK